MNKGIIVASFGTTFEETRKLCIESVENDIKDEFEDIEVKRAFTSRIVIKRLEDRDGIKVLNEKEAVESFREDSVDQIYIQPLHIISGYEYEKISSLKDSGIKIGAPLLSWEEDYQKVVETINSSDLKENEALIFMGHGTDHEADKSYKKLEAEYRKQSYDNVYVGTVEGSIDIEDIIEKIQDKGYKKLVLQPFMLVAGDHAINDMASDEGDSWKTILEKEGFEVETRVKGLGEYKGIRDIYREHLKKLMEEN